VRTLRWAIVAVGFEGCRDRADQPGVDGEPVGRGGLVHAGLDGIRQTERGARCARVVEVDARDRQLFALALAARLGDDELHVPPAQPHVDRAGGEIASDLADGRSQNVEQHQPGSGIQSGGEPFGDGAGVVRAVLRGIHQLAVQVADVCSELHGTIMTP
jgi:hypothetical protein